MLSSVWPRYLERPPLLVPPADECLQERLGPAALGETGHQLCPPRQVPAGREEREAGGGGHLGLVPAVVGEVEVRPLQ